MSKKPKSKSLGQIAYEAKYATVLLDVYPWGKCSADECVKLRKGSKP